MVLIPLFILSHNEFFSFFLKCNSALSSAYCKYIITHIYLYIIRYKYIFINWHLSKIAICRPRASGIIHLQWLRCRMRQNDFCFHSTAILHTNVWRENGLSFSTLIQFFARIIYLLIFIQGIGVRFFSVHPHGR